MPPRTFNRISDAAKENSISRMLVGIHFRLACTAGYRQGLASAMGGAARQVKTEAGSSKSQRVKQHSQRWLCCFVVDGCAPALVSDCYGPCLCLRFELRGTSEEEDDRKRKSFIELSLSVTRFHVTFSNAGIFPYICALHDELGMTGQVNVRS